MKKTVRLNEVRINELRKARGWSQRDLADWTDEAVRRLAQKEKDAGRPGKFTRRVKVADRYDKSAGISPKAVANIEKGRRIYPETGQIVAVTLKKPLKKLIVPDPG